MKMKAGKLKGYTQKMKEWIMNSYLLSENYITYGNPTPSNTMMEEPIIDTWSVKI